MTQSMLYSKYLPFSSSFLVQSNTYAGRGSLTAGNNALNNVILGNGSNAVNGGVATANLIMQTSYSK